MKVLDTVCEALTQCRHAIYGSCYEVSVKIFTKNCVLINLDLSKAETQALTNYGSGEDENEDEEIEEFEEGPVDVQTSLQANTETTEENEHDDQVFQCRLTHSPPVFL